MTEYMFAVQGFRGISDLFQKIRDNNVIICHVLFRFGVHLLRFRSRKEDGILIEKILKPAFLSNLILHLSWPCVCVCERVRERERESSALRQFITGLQVQQADSLKCVLCYVIRYL